jgi:hypothetical protein
MSQARQDLFPALRSKTDFSKSGLYIVRQYIIENSNVASSCRDRTETESEAATNLTHTIVSSMIQQRYSNSDVISAASQCFAVGDVHAAYHLLRISGEYDLAFAIAKIFDIPLDTATVRNIALRCLYLDDLELALDVLTSYLATATEDIDARRNPQTVLKKSNNLSNKRITSAEESPLISPLDIERALLISRHKKAKNMVDRDDMLQQHSLPAVHIWLQVAIEKEAIGQDAEAMGCYSVCGDLSQVLR